MWGDRRKDGTGKKKVWWQKDISLIMPWLSQDWLYTLFLLGNISITLNYFQKIFCTLEDNSACRCKINSFILFAYLPHSFLTAWFQVSQTSTNSFWHIFLDLTSLFLYFWIEKDIIHGKSKKLGAAQKSQKWNIIFTRLVLILTIFCS